MQRKADRQVEEVWGRLFVALPGRPYSPEWLSGEQVMLALICELGGGRPGRRRWMRAWKKLAVDYGVTEHRNMTGQGGWSRRWNVGRRERPRASWEPPRPAATAR